MPSPRRSGAVALRRVDNEPELRPHRDPGQIPALVDAQRADGYRVVASIVDDLVVAAAGFRLSSNLALGRAIYVDDLVTLPQARGAGHARSLLEWILTEAIPLSCSYVHLDSATHRHAAHRLCLTATSPRDTTSQRFTSSDRPDDRCWLPVGDAKRTPCAQIRRSGRP